MAPKRARSNKQCTPAQIQKAERDLNMPLVTDAELEAAEAKLQDAAELKRQHGKMTTYLKSQGIKQKIENAPPEVRKKFFRTFVANKITGMKDKDYEVAQVLNNKKQTARQWDWMNEEMIVIKKGKNWAAEKLLLTENNSKDPEALEQKDVNQTNRWLKQYKIFHDCINYGRSVRWPPFLEKNFWGENTYFFVEAMSKYRHFLFSYELSQAVFLV